MNLRCLFGHAWREVAFRSKEARRETWHPPIPQMPLPPDPPPSKARDGHTYQFLGEVFEQCARCGKRNRAYKFERVVADRWVAKGELPDGTEKR